MINLKPPKYLFCPFCGNNLKSKIIDKNGFKYCQNCDWVYYPHVGAASCGVAIKNNKVLLVKRAREPYKNTWMFPAGFISYGEHPEDTVIREMKEETGLDAKILRLLSVEQVDDDPRSMGHFGFFYQVKVKGKFKLVDKEENGEVGWFDLHKLPKIGWHGHIKMLKELGRII